MTQPTPDSLSEAVPEAFREKVQCELREATRRINELEAERLVALAFCLPASAALAPRISERFRPTA